mgnify:CR=1 FL=1
MKVSNFRLQSSSVFNRIAMKALPLFLLSVLFTFNACVFEDFDEPPLDGLITLTGNTTVQELKDLHTLGSDPTAIPDGTVLEAVVVGNDISGNIFPELYVQDQPGGLVMRIDVVGLNALYPEGAPVALRLDDMYIGDFNGKYQLTIIGGDRIPNGLLSEVVLYNGTPGTTVELMPRLITIDELNDDETFARLQNTLVRIENLQFIDSDSGAPFADVPGEQDLNRTLRDCFGNDIVTRTSRFSDFAGSLTPTGNGDVIALVDAFGSTRQLKIRAVTDFSLDGERCGISVGGTLISIADLRDQFNGSTTNASTDTKIRGIVISDFTTSNINSQNLVLQDGNAGILIRFTSDHSFARGTDLEVTVSGLELSEFNGLLQVNNVPLGNAGDQGAGTEPTPREVTVATINASPNDYESTLVSVVDATISGAATLGNNLTVTDASGSIPMFNFNSATFGNVAVPADAVTVTAIVGDFNGVQLNLRDADDVGGGGGGGGGGDPEAITAGELRDLFAGGAGFAPADRFIEGVVVTDVDNGNITGRNLAIQTGESGIIIRFTDNHTFPLNQSIKVDVSGLELSEFNGLLQVNNVPNANATDNGAGMAPEPREATIAEIVANAEAWESTVVVIEDATISGGSTYDGNLSVTDPSGLVISMFTRGAASFSEEAIPSGAVTLTAVVSQFVPGWFLYIAWPGLIWFTFTSTNKSYYALPN